MIIIIFYCFFCFDVLQGLFYTNNKGIRYSFTVPSNSSNIIIDDDERFGGPIFSYDFTFKKKNGHKHNGHHKHNGRNKHRNRDELKETKDYGTRTRERNENSVSQTDQTDVNTQTESTDVEIENVERNKTGESEIGIGELKSTENKPEQGITEDKFGGGVYLNEPMAKESGETSKEDLNGGKFLLN